MTYKFLDHTADVMFEVKAKTLNTLFKDSAKAIFETIADVKTIKCKVKKKVVLEGDVEQLLYDFLEEIIFMKDADSLIFKKVDVKVVGKKLEAVFYGDKINIKEHKLKGDIKAVTWHGFGIRGVKGFFVAKVLVDI